MSEANKTQVGGTHYKGVTIEHWDYCWMYKFDFFQYQITKYVQRWRQKGGIQDLEKAQHFLTKYIETIKAEEAAKEIVPLPSDLPKDPAEFMQYVKPDGWVGFTYEGSDAEGFHFRCKRCLLRLNPLKQYQPPWDVHDPTVCKPIAEQMFEQVNREPQGTSWVEPSQVIGQPPPGALQPPVE
jgi:hypothetical protein